MNARTVRTYLFGIPAAVSLFASALILTTSVHVWLPVMWLLTGTILLLWWAWHVGKGGDMVHLIAGVVVAILIRAVFAWMIHDHPLRSLDGIIFWLTGSRLELMFSTPRSREVDLVAALGTATGAFYYVYTALISWVLHDTIFLHFTNALIGTANGIMAYLLARIIWNRKVAVMTAWLMWTLPIYIMHDSQNLRGGFALFGILASVYGAQAFAERWTWRGVLIFTLGIGLLFQVRNYIALGVLGIVAMGLMVTRRSGRLKMFLLLASVAGALGVIVARHTIMILFGQLGQGYSFFDLLIAGHQGLVDLQSRSSAFYGVVLSSPSDLISFLPIGLIHAFLTPLPWNVESTYTLLFPEVILRYFLLPFAAVGLLESVRTRFRMTFIPVALMISMAMLYAILELGGNFRHNMQFFPFLHMLAAYGICVARKWALEVVILTACLSLGIWGYAFESVRLTIIHFTVLLSILAIIAGALIHREMPSHSAVNSE